MKLNSVLFNFIYFLKVTSKGHHYFKNIETREEGGTPNIIGSIRAGLAMQLKMVYTYKFNNRL